MITQKIIKKILLFETKIKSKIISFLYKTYFSIFYTNVKWGKDIKLYGTLLTDISEYSRIEFGNNLVFNSKTNYNFAGINKPVSIAVQKGAELIIGDFSGFSGTSIYISKKLIIGKHCNFGANTAIWDTDFHPISSDARRVHNVSKILSKEINIGDDVFIGANSLILKGVTIGNRSVIGAGSVVTKNIPNDEIWAGNPAKFIRRL
jgi:acetyltransferase-like isoleucine patch superfamily enzyme